MSAEWTKEWRLDLTQPRRPNQRRSQRSKGSSPLTTSSCSCFLHYRIHVASTLEYTGCEGGATGARGTPVVHPSEPGKLAELGEAVRGVKRSVEPDLRDGNGRLVFGINMQEKNFDLVGRKGSLLDDGGGRK